MSTPGNNSQNYYVTTFYQFKNLPDPNQVKSDLEQKAVDLNVKGLIIIGTEGFNATVSCSTLLGFESFKNFIRDYFTIPELFFKDSISQKSPFRRFKVKIREEIVTLGTPELVPNNKENHHLSPAEWNKVLKEENDFLLIDTRNWYETKIGTFKGAVNPGIDKFTEFPEYVEKHSIPKDKKMLIFCTGGIRCEKGILELQRQGFENVFQLNGGIINYIKEYPNDQFEGECFVFDHRVALDQDLAPTEKYGLCPHCGQPSSVEIECKRCDTHELICEDCAHLEWKKDTCSKNCAYQYELHPESKAPRQIRPFEVERQREVALMNPSPL
ncbi:MAG: hypothetical protein IPM97_06425 [Bdellovibrionaceae bacterium]|nr:hypothetical protein [Pseudobdellovibrionaceae bacterium]